MLYTAQVRPHRIVSLRLFYTEQCSTQCSTRMSYLCPLQKTTSEDTEGFNNIIATFTELCPINISQPTVPLPRNKPAECTKPENTGHVMETLDTTPSDTSHDTGALSSSGFIPLGGDESETSDDFRALGSTGGGGGGDRGNAKRPYASVKRGFGSEDFLGFNDYQPLHVNECVKNQNRKKKK